MTWIGTMTTLSLKRNRASGSCRRTFASRTKYFFTSGRPFVRSVPRGAWSPPSVAMLHVHRNAAASGRRADHVLLHRGEGLVELHDVADHVAGVHHGARRRAEDEAREGGDD